MTARMGAASRVTIAPHAIDSTWETFESLYAKAMGVREMVPAA